MNNIAVLRNYDKTFTYCPLFDNGAALFSDTQISYNLNVTLESCYEGIEAKPFSRSFDEQMDTAEDLYGVHFSYWFTEKDIAGILKNAVDYYSPQIIERVFTVLRLQMRKYQYMRKKLYPKGTP